MRTLLIGYGNTLRRDDALGVRVAERLGGLACHQLTPELAPLVATAERVVFVDASCDGESRCLRIHPAGSLTGLHSISPEQLLAFAALYRDTPQEAFLVTGRGFDFSHGEGLSQLACASLDAVVKAATQLL